MYCTNCGNKIVKNFCIHCGLMTNGVYVDTGKIQKGQEIETYFGKDYDKIARNQNWATSGILGPVYILARGHLLAGIALCLIDIIIIIVLKIFNEIFLHHAVVSIFNNIYLIINRIVWATVGNIIYIKLTKKKIENMKKGINYNIDDAIEKQYKRDKRLLITKYCLLFVLCFYLYLYIYAYTYNVLELWKLQ